MKSVYSSMVAEVGYDTDTQELLVKWARSGKLSGYAGVPEETAQALADGKMASVGLFINSDIKDQYSHRYR